MSTICFSLVLYKHTIKCIKPLLESIGSLAKRAPHYRIMLCVYDGSPSIFPSSSESQIKSSLLDVDISFEKGANIGFGCANNRNFLRASLLPCDLFVVVNPDIWFRADQLIPLLDWVFSGGGCSCVAPLVLLEGGEIQYTAKKDPTILSLLLGRFAFLRRIPILRSYDSWHKNLHQNYASEVISSSYLSGCFLLIPVWAFASVGGFCEKYFLHVEDADIVRRLSGVGKTLHNPIGIVVHGWARGSHSSIGQILCLIRSFYIYSSIWGLRVI